MSKVCGSTEPRTSVPMMASVPVARSQTRTGNSTCNPKKETTQGEHPDTPIRVPFALRSVLAVGPRIFSGVPA